MTSAAAIPAPISVPPTGLAVQVPMGSSGGSIVNDGSCQVVLNPTNPAQGPGTILLPGGSTPWPAGVTCYATVAMGTIAPGQIYVLPGISVYAAGDLTVGGSGVGGGTNGLGVLNTENPINTGVTAVAFPDIPNQFTIHSWGIYLNNSEASPPTNGYATLICPFFDGFVPEGVTLPGFSYDVIPLGGEWSSTRLQGVSINLNIPGLGVIDGPVIFNEFDVGGGLNFFINIYNTSDN